MGLKHSRKQLSSDFRTTKFTNFKNLDSNGRIKSKFLPNTLVEILSGTERGRIGKIQSMDEDNASCFVELEKTRNIVRVSQYNLKTIGKKSEADKNSLKYEKERNDRLDSSSRKYSSDYRSLSRR